MNKKQLIIAALATILSVSAANATSTITGITNGGSGTFNINPLKANGDVGYRYYDNFKLGEGDIANLIFRMQSGDQRAINTFINLVGGSDKAQINGILNSIRDGSFFNGHTVFMTKNGLTIGSKGVVNVGTLSVLAPTNFNKLKEEYDANNYVNINNINHMRNNTSASNPNNYGANSPVEINGLVLARNGIDIRGSQVDIGSTAKLVNGYNGSDKFSNYDAAKAVFDTLVNTNGIVAAANKISNNGSKIVIKSGAGSSSHINVAGQIANLNSTEMAITNHGNGGLNVNGGVIASNGKLNVYNNNSSGALNVTNSGKLLALKNSLSATSKGGMNVASGSKLQALNDVEVVNKGNKLTFAGTALGKNIDVVNNGAGGMSVTGTLGSTTSNAKTVRLSNTKGAMSFTGNANATESVSMYGQSTASGMDIGGTVNAGKGILVENRAGNLNLKGTMNVEKGDLAIGNKGTGKLTTTSASKLEVQQGRLIVRNKATNGMDLDGTIINNAGQTSINNDKGTMAVGGTISNNGTMGIINNGTGAMAVAANVTNTNGTVKLINYKNGTSTNGMTITGKIENTGAKTSDRLYVYNGKGGFALTNGQLISHKGNIIVTGRENSSGIQLLNNSLVRNENGNISIVNKGTKSGVGIAMNGTVENLNGKTAINNYAGNMAVAGDINVKGDLGIINRGIDRKAGSGEAMTVNANINSQSGNINIKNNGNGAMTVGGTITHNGRLNVLANKGQLNLTGTVNNNGKDMSYFAARNQGTGIDVAKSFVGNTTNGGTMLIKNISGNDGLTYAGTMKSTNGGQIEVYNMKGDLNVTSDAKMLGGQPTVILNKGEGMTVQAGEFTGDLKIVNKGSKHANVASKYQSYLKEQLKN